jgi:hypothetical protein
VVSEIKSHDASALPESINIIKPDSITISNSVGKSGLLYLLHISNRAVEQYYR